MTSCVRTFAQSLFAPIICHSPTPRPLSTPSTGRRIQQRYMSSFLHLFLEVYPIFDISILDRNSMELLQSYQCLKISRRAIVVCNRLFIDRSRYPSPSCFRCCSSIISKCVRQKLYVLLYDCVYNMAIGSVSAPMCVLTFNLHVPFFILFRLVCSLSFFLLSYSGFSNHRGSLLSHSRVKCSFVVIYYLLLLCTIFVLPQHAFFLLICVVCHVRQSASILSRGCLFFSLEPSRDSLIFFLWSLCKFPVGLAFLSLLHKFYVPNKIAEMSWSCIQTLCLRRNYCVSSTS
jgi:hypothetical protein